jgi:hypothetical protein
MHMLKPLILTHFAHMQLLAKCLLLIDNKIISKHELPQRLCMLPTFPSSHQHYSKKHKLDWEPEDYTEKTYVDQHTQHSYSLYEFTMISDLIFLYIKIVLSAGIMQFLLS